MRKIITILLMAGALAVPANAGEMKDTIYIPSIHLYTHLGTTLDYGPWAYYQDSDTLAIAGHRATHTHPFFYLNRIKPGDLIRVANHNFYAVRTLIVRPWQTWMLRWKGLVLSACTRPDGLPTSTEWRMVVLAR